MMKINLSLLFALLTVAPALKAQNGLTNAQIQTRLINVAILVPPGQTPYCCTTFTGPGVLGGAGDPWNELGSLQSLVTQTNSLCDTLGNTTGAGIAVTGAAGSWEDFQGGDWAEDAATEGLLAGYLYGNGSPMTVQISGLETNTSYNLIIYSAGNQPADSATMTGAVNSQMGRCSRNAFTLGANYAQNTTAPSDGSGNLMVTITGAGTFAFNGLQVEGPVYGNTLPPSLSPILSISNIDGSSLLVSLTNATNIVYQILSSPNLSMSNAGAAGTFVTAWGTEAEIFPDTNPTDEAFGTGNATITQNGRPNLFLLARDWTGIDTLSNGVPDWWEWKFFGVTDLPGTTNCDEGPGSLLYDYQHNIDPNVIQFTVQFASTFLSTNRVSGTMITLAGQTFYIATQIGSSNHSLALWNQAASNFTASFPTNGFYDIWIGARGLPTNAQQTWMDQWLSVYDVPLAVTLISPTNNVVSVPVYQLLGEANERLSSITFDVSNASGAFSNQTAFVTGSVYSAHICGITTNYFQCSANLSAGANTIIVHATDGNSNTVSATASVTLDYTTRTNPPALSILWPSNNAQISGSNFTLQAQLDDPTASILAAVGGTNFPGIVEQSGQAWIQGIPLSAGTNSVDITVQTLGGFQSTANLEVVQSPFSLTIDPLPTNELNQPYVTVTGTISDPSQNVWVNGVEANITGNTWEADNVPVSVGGNCGIYTVAGPTAASIKATLASFQQQPALVVISSYFESYHTYYYDYVGGGWFSGDVFYGNRDEDAQWSWNTGGQSVYDEYGLNGDGVKVPPSPQSQFLPPLDNGNPPGEINPTWIWANNISMYSLDTNGGGYDLQTGECTENTRVMILPPGQQQVGTTNVYLVTASAAEFSTPAGWPGLTYFGDGGDTPLPASWMSIQGQNLVNYATNSDGSIWGGAYISGLAGQTLDVTPTVNQFYSNNCGSFQVQAYQCQLVSFCHASIPSDYTRTNIGVGEEVVIMANQALPPTTAWSTTSGQLSSPTGMSTTLRAPAGATNLTVTANVGGALLTENFTVLQPMYETSLIADVDSNNPSFPPGTQGVGMYLTVIFFPTNVSFYNVQMLELPEGATNITGYFTNAPASALIHPAGTNWTTLSQANYSDDHAAFWGWSPPWTPGSYNWSIPVLWQVIGYPGITNQLPTNEYQQHIILDTMGTSREIKLGSQTTRYTNGVTTIP
jgi:hypothetical protein